MAGPQPGEHPATEALPTRPQPTTTDPTSGRPTPEPQLTPALTTADLATARPATTGSATTGPTTAESPTDRSPTAGPATTQPTTVESPTGAAGAPVDARPTGSGHRLPGSAAESTATTAAVRPAGAAPEPSATTAEDDEATGTIAPRWTGSAAIPPPTPRRRWWQRLMPTAGTPAPTAAADAATRPVPVARPARDGPVAQLDPTRAEITRRQPEPLNRTAVMPDAAEVGAALAFRPEPEEPYRDRPYQDWENTPPVDPWADHDTLWQAAPGTPPADVGPPAGPPAGPFPPAVFGRGTLPPTPAGSATTVSGRAAAPPHPAPTNPPTSTIPARGQDAAGQDAGAPSWRRRLFTRPAGRTARPAAGTAATGPAQAGAAPAGATDTPAGGAASAGSRASWASPATQGPVPPWWNPPNAAAQAAPAPGTPPSSSGARRAQPLMQGGSALRLPPSAPVPPPGWAPPGQAGGQPPPATAPTRPAAPPKSKPGKAPKESRADRKRRLRTGDLPPPWTPPTPGPPPPRRRKRRRLRLWILLLIAVLAAAYWYGWASLLGLPYAGQYPVSPSLPERVADLHLRDDASSNRTAERLTASLYHAGVAADEVFAGVYGDDNGKRVAVFGTTGFRWSPGADVEDEIQRLAAEYDLTDITSYDLGETGAHERCGVGRSDGTSVVVCSWADHGSLGSAVLTRRSAADSAEVLGLLREAVLSRP